MDDRVNDIIYSAVSGLLVSIYNLSRLRYDYVSHQLDTMQPCFNENDDHSKKTSKLSSFLSVLPISSLLICLRYLLHSFLPLTIALLQYADSQT